MPPPVSAPKRLSLTGGRGRLAALAADCFQGPGYRVSRFSREPGGGFSDTHDLAALGDCEALLHLAWSTLPVTAEQASPSATPPDLPFLERLLDSIAARPVAMRPHLVFFSSGGAVYGNAPGRPNREDDNCQPIGRYGAAKLAAERLITGAAARHALDCTILRISNPYGYPVPSGRVQGLIPRAIRAALESQTLPLWGDGHACKDFIHHTDFLSALRLVVDRRLTGIFNLCVGESHSVREIISLVEKHTGRPLATAMTPAPAWDVQDSRLDNRKFVAATGWRALVSLDEGIRQSVATALDAPR